MKIIWKTAQNISIKSIFYDIQAYSVSPRGGIKKGRVHIGVSTPTGTLPCQNGGDLLSRLRSTIGVAELNCPVRNGKGWNLRAKATSISLRP